MFGPDTIIPLTSSTTSAKAIAGVTAVAVVFVLLLLSWFAAAPVAFRPGLGGCCLVKVGPDANSLAFHMAARQVGHLGLRAGCGSWQFAHFAGVPGAQSLQVWEPQQWEQCSVWALQFAARCPNFWHL